MKLLYLNKPVPEKHSVSAFKTVIKYYNEIITEKDNEIQLLRSELETWKRCYYRNIHQKLGS